ncbi:MAG: hypothetical protein IPJ87_13280 [Flavobacteriales bacterium]|jgi:hypothetical protein|nr:hypothetical protein [Flavobacteriales bacterium]MBK7942823.1 hypothetical protein [Flavobacteriales bacterium]MBK8949527.1 hypothetical protein [Flavobacteriales bacterium]MBK9698775.1 hypothetical protein [Flavobacteriales bacterium]
MKTKVTLSLNKRTVALLRKAGARRAQPMSAIVDELVEALDRTEAGKDEVPAWLSEMGTWLSGKITEKDLEDDPRLAYAYGYKPKVKRTRKRA